MADWLSSSHWVGSRSRVHEMESDGGGSTDRWSSSQNLVYTKERREVAWRRGFLGSGKITWRKGVARDINTGVQNRVFFYPQLSAIEREWVVDTVAQNIGRQN